jgi:hypothetical protein
MEGSSQTPRPTRLVRAAATALLGLLGVVVALAGTGAAPSSGVQITPDGKRALISKDVGGQRWAITRDSADRTVTGNVFSPGGGRPQFVWCEDLGRDGDDVRLRCSGADQCPLAPCTTDEWLPLGEVVLPESFFLPPAGASAPERTPELGPPAGAPAEAPSGIQLTPDRARALVSKDVGGQRWAITLHGDDRSVTGNVFSPGGGDPQFVWCEQKGVNEDDVELACFGAARCAATPCDAAEWTFIADVSLPRSFLAPDESVGANDIAAAILGLLGDEAGFVAVLLAADKGYSLRQIARAALAERLTAEGDLLTRSGAVEPPAGRPAAAFAPASSSEAALGSAPARQLYQRFAAANGAQPQTTLLVRLLDLGYSTDQLRSVGQGAEVVDCAAAPSAQAFQDCVATYGDVVVLVGPEGPVPPAGGSSGVVVSERGPRGSCGNGRTDDGDSCDGADLRGETCESLGFTGGRLRCTGDCEVDVSDCRREPVCNDGVAEGDERCDGADLRGETCEGLGFAGGALRCSDCSFDASGCSREPVCNNGVAETSDREREECDGADLRGQTCSDLGFAGGVLRCDVCRFDVTGCSREPVCNNGVAEASDREREECDGADLRGVTCENFGERIPGGPSFTGGTLRCSGSCSFDVSGCREEAACDRDGVAEPPVEDCDGNDLRGETCTSVDAAYVGGELRCDASCNFDVGGCLADPECGDGRAEGDEACDRFDFRGQTCESLGLPSGNLICNGDCEIDSRSCRREQECDDGVVEGTEQCDGANLNGASCESLGFDSGTLGCGGDCQFDTSGCFSCDGTLCPDGSCFDGSVVCCGGGLACDPGEQCIPAGGGCCPAGATLCPGGGCYVAGAVCCGDGSACPAGSVCVTGGCCPSSTPFLCPGGAFCTANPATCP